MAQLVSALEFSKVIIAFFITLYAYYFLRRSDHYIERKPWEYLFIAALLLFASQMLTMFAIFKPLTFDQPLFDDVRRFLEFLFFGFLLFSFIYQHNLLLKRPVLVISRTKANTLFDKLMARIGYPAPKEAKEEAEPVDKELDALSSEQRPSLEIAPLRDEVVEKARRLVDKTERLITEHRERIPADRLELVKRDLEELKAALQQEPPDAERVASLVAKLTGHA